jgi:hypothetical protein
VSTAVLRARAAAVLGVDVSAWLPQVRVPLLIVISVGCTTTAFRHGHRTRCPHFLLQSVPSAASRHINGFVQGVAAGP